MNNDGNSSSGEEDGDANWKAAINSVANTSFISNGNIISNGNGGLSISSKHLTTRGQDSSRQPEKPKHYQIKAQKLLDDILERTLEIVEAPIEAADEEPVKNEGGIRLFKHAPRGVVFDHIDELKGPKKRPKIIPGEEIDEKSKKFRRKLQSVAVDGSSIIATAETAYQKSLARLEAKNARTKEAARKEEERVAELKKIRGEKWLPSIAREMQLSKLK